MRIPWRWAALTAIACALAGCGYPLQGWERANNFTVSAVPLCEAQPGYHFDASTDPRNDGCVRNTPSGTPGAPAPAPAPLPDMNPPPSNAGDPTVKSKVGNVVLESEIKCSRFLNGLVLAENSSNVFLGGTAILTSALGTVFTPLAVVHGFTAASTVASGWRAEINSDIYAKMAVADYALAIQTTYYNNMANYLQALNGATDVVYEVEVGKVAIYHKSCSLAAAQGILQNSLQTAAAAGAQSGTTQQTVKVAESPDAATTYTITGTAPTLSLPVVASVKPVPAVKTIPQLADALIAAVNGNAAFANLGITATEAIDTSHGGATVTGLVLHAPAGLNIVWTASPPAALIVASSPATTSTTTTPKAISPVTPPKP